MQFSSTPVEPHTHVSASDDRPVPSLTDAPDDAVYVVSMGSLPQLNEILGLLDALGRPVVGHERIRLREPHPKTHLGSGTCEAVSERALASGAAVLVLDAQLSPSQTRNIEEATGFSVMDRELVILGVFLKHARTKSARIQVEIAHLTYLRPRIRGLGLDMDQQAGGVMNGKGAGETASELLARQLDDRLVKLRRQAKKIDAQADHRRAKRRCARIALVGYTNAGKTSLMNALTGAELSTRSRPFETLDTTSRSLSRHGLDVVLHDTVGFIRDLPERLLPSFASTLAEAKDATLLVIVVDSSDPEWPHHLETTNVQLDRLEVTAVRMVVFNKLDAALPSALEALKSQPEALSASSRSAASISRLGDALLDAVLPPVRRVFVPYTDTERSSRIHAKCRVLDTEATDDGLWLTVQGDDHVVGA